MQDFKLISRDVIIVETAVNMEIKLTTRPAVDVQLEQETKKLRTCWASTLRDCSDKLSREHSVSACLFSSDAILVQGFPWCLTEPKKVGLASAVKKQLCVKHNSLLSETDNAARTLSAAFEQVAATVGANALPIEIAIDGRKFERWALKTLINICTQDGHRVGRDSTAPDSPSPSLVRTAFGLRRFPQRAGMYLVGPEQGEFEHATAFTFAPLLNKEGYVEGTLLKFCGFVFAIVFDDPGKSLDSFNIQGGNRAFAPGPVGAVWHSADLKLMRNGNAVTLKFKW
jgi:hypothetical protein